MLLHKDLTHIQSQIKPRLLFVESFTLTQFEADFLVFDFCLFVINTILNNSLVTSMSSWKRNVLAFISRKIGPKFQTLLRRWLSVLL